MAEISIGEKFKICIESLHKKLEKDKNILGFIVMGSVSYDKVWEKSDLDIVIVVNDNTRIKNYINLIENGIYVNGGVWTRTEFVKFFGNSIGGSFEHSITSHGNVIFSKDEVITNIMKERRKDVLIGERDKHHSIAVVFAKTLKVLYRVERWIEQKKDINYAYMKMLKTLRGLAAIEVLKHNGVPNREVVLQALEYGDSTFKKIYIDLMDKEKEIMDLSEALDIMYDYIERNKHILTKVPLEYFKKNKEVKSLSSIHREMNCPGMTINMVAALCQWMCSEGILIKDHSKIEITQRGSGQIYEPAYAISY